MVIVPVVLSFNDKYTIPAGVCITSLLENAEEGTFYDIYIMYSSKRLSKINKDRIFKLKTVYKQCDISFIDVQDFFQDEFEIREITVDAYYRLAIPEYIKKYDKVIYCDVDMIINKDLAHLMGLNLESVSLAAVKVSRSNIIPKKYIRSLNLDLSEYINSGFLVFNVKKIRSDNSLSTKVYPLLGRKFTYQDQDILNIAFKGDIKFMDSMYNYTFSRIFTEKPESLPYICHYTGVKPWNQLKPFGELWWEYYRKSIFFQYDYYHEFTKDVYLEYFRNKNIGKIFYDIGVFKVWQGLKLIFKSLS